MKISNRNHFLVLLTIIAVMIGVFATGCNKDNSDTGLNNEFHIDEVSTQLIDNSVLDIYQVEIENYRLTEDFEGDPVVVVTYSFTNKSTEKAAFWIAVEDSVFQDGELLERAYVLKDGDPYDSSKQSADIEAGESLDVEVAYLLKNTDSELDVEAKVYVDFTHNIVNKTFSIK